MCFKYGVVSILQQACALNVNCFYYGMCGVVVPMIKLCNKCALTGLKINVKFLLPVYRECNIHNQYSTI